MIEKIYSNKSKNPLTWFLVLFSITYAVVGIVMVVVITTTIIKSTEYSAWLMLILVPIITCLIVWSLDLILWQITGKETVELTKEGLKVTHSGRVFRYKRYVSVKSIKKITNECNQSDVLRDFWIPQWQPKIKVTYDYDDSIRIGRNLSETECTELLGELQEFYPELKIEAYPAPHKLTLNEILFIIWAVSSVFIFIPAWFVVPILQEKYDKERIEKYTERMSFIRQNYQKMYCYSDAYGECCKRVSLLNRQDSIYESSLISLCHVEDSLAHFSTGAYSVPRIMPSNVKMPFCNFFSGLVYVVKNSATMSLIYSNYHMTEPVYVLNNYLHMTPPQCEQSDYVKDDYGRLCWDETDDFIKNGLLWRFGIE